MPIKTSNGKWKWGNIERDSKKELAQTVYGIWKKNGSKGSFSEFYHGTHGAVTEDLGSFLKKSVIISMLAIPGILNADELNKLPEISSTTIKELADKDIETFGGYSKAAAANIVARTLFAEAADQTEAGKKAVASVIWNRANHDPQKLISICFARKQFSCWNDVAPATNQNYTAKNYKIKLPAKLKTDSNVEFAWEDCKEIAADLLNADFVSTIGNRNSYYNPDKSSPEWADDLQNTLKLGNHTFGYLPEHDPKAIKTNHVKIHVVKAGETLSGIALKYNTTVNKLVRKNKLKNKNSLKVGQKIKI